MKGIKWKTPRPLTPELPSSEISFNSDDCFTSKSDIKKGWETTARGRHRSRIVSGWMSIPRAVVNATALNVKRLKCTGRESSGHHTFDETAPQSGKSAIRSSSKFHRRKQAQSLQLKKVIETKSYEDLLEENLTEIESLREKVGCYTPERYTHLPVFPTYEYDEARKENEHILQENIPEDDVKEMKMLEESLPSWKRSFIPLSKEITSSLTMPLPPNLPKSTCDFKQYHSRPMTADSSLQSQKSKGSQVKKFRPSSASSITSFRARKTCMERDKFITNAVRSRLPGYPPRIVRNRTKRKCIDAMSSRRPIMTPNTSWYPVSFHSKMLGSLIKLDYDMYGYQSIAEYQELCQTLDDGMVVIDQPMEVGDSIKMKVLETDRRMGLMYVAMKNVSENIVDQFEVFYEETKLLPRNRLSQNSASSEDWKYSYEIADLKPGDELEFTRDIQGKIKCCIDSKSNIIMHLPDGNPRNLALCLGLGVTKVQLLGGHKGCDDLLMPYDDKDDREIDTLEPYEAFDFNLFFTSLSECVFCGRFMKRDFSDGNINFAVPYGCYHIRVCRDCQRTVECRLCKAPLCWASCPVCDTRLQTF